MELTELFFSLIDRLDSLLNSYLLLTYAEAMRTAKTVERTIIRGCP